jgi:hypothetical protein
MQPQFPVSRVLLRYALAAAIGTFIVSVISLFDPRELLGEPIWVKPFKFWASTSIVAASLYWIMERLEKFHPREIRIISYGTVLAFAYEVLVISLQAARGVRSHFNIASPFDTFIFNSMGVVILIAWGLSFWATRLLFVEKTAEKIGEPLFIQTARAGMCLFLVGASTGIFMILPRAEQNGLGGHLMGAADGTGSSLRLLGWSREFGDLRVAHFNGMHFLQILIITYFLLRYSESSPKYSHQVVTILTAVGAVSFLLSLWQALQGQSLIGSEGIVRAIYFTLVVIVFGLLSGLAAKSFRKWKKVRKAKAQVI